MKKKIAFWFYINNKFYALNIYLSARTLKMDHWIKVDYIFITERRKTYFDLIFL